MNIRDHVHGQSSIANWFVPMLTDTGMANVYAVVATPAPIAYVTGMQIVFKAVNANTGSATLNVNSLGAKTLKKFFGGGKTDLGANDIGAGEVIEVTYDGTDFLVRVVQSDITPVENLVEFYEDFEGYAGADAPLQSKHIWSLGAAANPASEQGIGGRIRVMGAGGAGSISLGGATAAHSTAFAVSKNPDMRLRWALLHAGGNTALLKRLGLTDGTLSADPTNGIFFRHNGVTTDNVIAVCRSASVESTLDTTVDVGASGTFHTGRLLVSGGGTNVEVFVDGVSRGNITANIPTAAMRPGAGAADPGADTNGLTWDYVQIKQSR